MGNETVDRGKVAQRAYQIYEARGKKNGSDFDDWLKAEQEVKNQEKGKGQPARKKAFTY